MRYVWGCVILLCLIFCQSVYSQQNFKKSKISNLSYEQIYDEPDFKGLVMIGTVRKYGVFHKDFAYRRMGAVLRSLRFQNITSVLEKKYGLKKNLLLAMIIQETNGVDILTNGNGDGGAGICHMQPSAASEFGLKTYKNCRRLISYQHGRDLKALIARNKSDRKRLIKYDDRFHPIKNLDAVARMISYYKSKAPSRWNKLNYAIYRYAGKKNYSSYLRNVKSHMYYLDKPENIEAIKDEFNRLNKNFYIGRLKKEYANSQELLDKVIGLLKKKYMTISLKNKRRFSELVNNKIYEYYKGDFDKYIAVHQEQNINYGLNKIK